jgi:ribosomal protein S27E
MALQQPRQPSPSTLITCARCGGLLLLVSDIPQVVEAKAMAVFQCDSCGKLEFVSHR